MLEYLSHVLLYVLGALSVIVGFLLYPKVNARNNVHTEAEETPDERERKLAEQWENMLNYDGNIKE
jgi:hypothetical protein